MSDEIYCMRRLSSELIRIINGFGEHPMIMETHNHSLYSEFCEQENYENLTDTSRSTVAKKWAEIKLGWIACDNIRADLYSDDLIGQKSYKVAMQSGDA